MIDALVGDDEEMAEMLGTVRADVGHYRVPARDLTGVLIPPPTPGSVGAILRRVWYVDEMDSARREGRPLPHSFAQFEALVLGELE